MKEDAVSEPALRQFLLGSIDEEERRRIESLFITDSLVREKILAAEQDLIDDYLDGSLTPADKQKFMQQYGETSAQKRKLRIATSIKDWATSQGTDSLGVKPGPISFWRRIRNGTWLKPAYAIPIAAVAMMVVIAIAAWLNNRIEQRNRQLAIQEEVVQLNVPSRLREVPPRMSALELRPVAVRSSESRTELVVGPDTEIAELRLLWIQKEHYPKYRAVVRRTGGSESVTIPDLQPEEDGRLIRLRLPNHILTRGAYEVELTGIETNAASGLSEEYRFSVSN